jgi:hypothetical protein
MPMWELGASMDSPIIIEGIPSPSIEDCGDVLVLRLYNERNGEYLNPFVEIISQHENNQDRLFPEIEHLRDRRIRVTIEVIG